MKKLTKTLGMLLGASLAATSAAGCGDNGVNCGEGTVNKNGSCVPDGSVVCVDGTRFNADKGTCEVDPTACQDGTVLVNGKCQDPAVVATDATENAEPNEDDLPLAGTINVPAIGAAKGYVIKGCITPHRDEDGNDVKDADVDLWVINATEPMLIDVQVDGVRGLVAGFQTITTDEQLRAEGFQRDALAITSDLAGRELYLPVAGTYAIAIADTRTILDGKVGPGNANTCYYATITQKKLPTSSAAPVGDTTGTYNGKVQTFAYTPQEGDILQAAVTPTKNEPTSENALGGIVMLNNGEFVRSASFSQSFFGSDPTASLLRGGLKASDKVDLIYDPTVVYSGESLDFELNIAPLRSKALPAANTAVTLTSTAEGVEALGDLQYTYFDVTDAGQITNLKVVGSERLNYTIVDADLNQIATGTTDLSGDLGDGGLSVTSDLGWHRFEVPGRYYAIFFTPGHTGDYTVTSTLFNATVGTATLGTPLANQALGNGERNGAFYNFSTAEKWISYDSTGTNFGSDVFVEFYPKDGVGRFDTDFFSDFGFFFEVAGDPAAGRVTAPAYDGIIKVQGSSPPAGNNATFSLDIAKRVFTEATASEATPFTQAAQSFAAGEVKRIFLTVAKGSRVTVTPTGAGLLNALIEQYGRDEDVDASSDEGGDALSFAAPQGFAALGVRNISGAASQIGVNITVKTPATFADACNGGMELAQTADSTADGLVGDEALTAAQTLPAGFNFSFFGAVQTTFKASANGWISFDPALPDNARFANRNYGANAADHVKGSISPYWDDITDVRICRKDAANTVTIQFTGVLFNSTTKVETQIVLYKGTNRFDLVYGPNHQANGASASAGARNLANTAGVSLFFNTAGGAAASSGFVVETP